MVAPLSIPDFLAGLEARGLHVAVDGVDLVLTGPKEARTEPIRAYLRARKLEIIEHLTVPVQDVVSERIAATAAFLSELDDCENREGLANLGVGVVGELIADQHGNGDDGDLPPVEDAPEFEDDAAPEVAEAVRQVYIAACAGLLPIERVKLGPGRSCENPNTYVVRCRQRIEVARRSLPLIGWAVYIDNLLMERTGVVAVALWWKTRQNIQRFDNLALEAEEMDRSTRKAAPRSDKHMGKVNAGSSLQCSVLFPGGNLV